ncbi:MAG: right-handed parallel beta-helix repeat-containing protein [Nitrosomonadales bacterium]|nr:right-handed parallel beta-helix repeat-containing protein [Nitrosomonadales bacterium]
MLRGLTINSQGGDAGISMTAGTKLSIDNCVISNFSIISSPVNQYGVLVQTPATVRIVNTLIRDNDIGIQIQDGATANISGSKFLGNSTYGIVAFNFLDGTTTTAAVSDTLVSQGGGVGIYAIVDSASTAIARAEIVRSIVSNYNEGVRAESQNGTASVSIRKSMVTGSSIYGLGQIGAGATMTSYGNNTLSNNSSNLLGTLTTVAPL